jgi:transcriptional regulator with XRE-family HTH domain
MLENFGARLSQLISARGLTQADFAKGLDSSPAFISDMIRGVKRPGAEFLSRISLQYQVSLDWLINGQGSLEGTSIIDKEQFLIVAMRVQLARLAASGNEEAPILIEELLGRKPSAQSSPLARQALLNELTSSSEESVFLIDLYNTFIINPDKTIGTQDALNSALQYYQPAQTDPLLALMAGRETATSNKAETAATNTVQINSGKNQRIAGKNFKENK